MPCIALGIFLLMSVYELIVTVRGDLPVVVTIPSRSTVHVMFAYLRSNVPKTRP